MDAPSAESLFCSEDDWRDLILCEPQWTGTQQTFRADDARTIGLTAGDEESPLVFLGYKVEPITGAIAVSLSLPEKWMVIVSTIRRRFEAAHRRKNTALPAMATYTNNATGRRTVDVLIDTRQSVLVDTAQEAVPWKTLAQGNRVAATLHFGGFVSSQAATQMFLSCSKIVCLPPQA